MTQTVLKMMNFELSIVRYDTVSKFFLEKCDDKKKSELLVPLEKKKLGIQNVNEIR